MSEYRSVLPDLYRNIGPFYRTYIRDIGHKKNSCDKYRNEKNALYLSQDRAEGPKSSHRSEDLGPEARSCDRYRAFFEFLYLSQECIFCPIQFIIFGLLRCGRNRDKNEGILEFIFRILINKQIFQINTFVTRNQDSFDWKLHATMIEFTSILDSVVLGKIGGNTGELQVKIGLMGLVYLGLQK